MLTLTRLRSAQRRRLVFHSMDSSVVKFVMKAVGQKCRGGSEIKRGQKYRELFFLGCHAYTLVCVLSVIDAMGIAKVIFFFSLSFKADKLLMLHSSLSWFITYLVSTFNPFPIFFLPYTSIKTRDMQFEFLASPLLYCNSVVSVGFWGRGVHYQ